MLEVVSSEMEVFTLRVSSLGRRTALGALLALSVPCCAQGVIVRVPDDWPTIQQGIDAAASGDTVLVAPGIYVEHLVIDSGDNGVVLLSSAGAESTVIDGLGLEGPPLLEIQDTTPPTAVMGLTFRRNQVMAGGGYRGGGIRCERAGVRLADNIIEDCFALHTGGGVYAHDSVDLVIVGNVIRRNLSGEGGGLHLEICVAQLTENVIEGNEAAGLLSYWGGGLAVYGGELILESNRIEANSALSKGGGLCLEGGVEGTITDNHIISNSAGSGGALYIRDASVLVERNTIVENESELPSSGVVRFLCRSYLPLCNGEVVFLGNIVAENSGTVFCVANGELPSFRENTIDGNGFLVVDVLADAEAGTLDMRGNWWGTADPDSIEALIGDCEDDPEIAACVDYSDWCSDPSCDGQVTSVAEDSQQNSRTTWSRIKSMYGQ